MIQPLEKFYFSPNLVSFDDMCGSVIPGEHRKDVPSDIWLDLEPSTSRKLRTLEKNLSDF